MKITTTELRTFTINATCERFDVSEAENTKRHNGYAMTVCNALGAENIDGFTLQKVDGYWRGTAEKSYIITVATDTTDDAIERACEGLRAMYDQEAVMLTYPSGKVAFIEA